MISQHGKFPKDRTTSACGRKGSSAVCVRRAAEIILRSPTPPLPIPLPLSRHHNYPMIKSCKRRIANILACSSAPVCFRGASSPIAFFSFPLSLRFSRGCERILHEFFVCVKHYIENSYSLFPARGTETHTPHTERVCVREREVRTYSVLERTQGNENIGEVGPIQ